MAVYGLAGASIISTESLFDEIRQLQPSYDAARMLVDKGLDAINQADEISSPHWYSATTANQTPAEFAKRANIRGHLAWYGDGNGDPVASFDDLRKWFRDAIIAYNEAVEVANQPVLRQAFGDYLDGVAAAIRGLPRAIGRAAGEILGGVASAAGEGAGSAVGGILTGLVSSPGGLIVLGIGAYLLWVKFGKGRAG